MSKRARDSLSSSLDDAWADALMRERSPKRRRIEEEEEEEESEEEVSNIFWMCFVDASGLFDEFLVKLLDPMSVAALACTNKHTHAGICRIDVRPRLPWPAPTCNIVGHGSSDRDIEHYLHHAQTVARLKLALRYDHIGRFRTLWSPSTSSLNRRIAECAIWISAAECTAHIILTPTPSCFPPWRAILTQRSPGFLRDVFQHVPFDKIKHWIRIFYEDDKHGLYNFMMCLIDAPVSTGKQREFFRVVYKRSISHYPPRVVSSMAQYLSDDMARFAAAHLREVLSVEILNLKTDAGSDSE